MKHVYKIIVDERYSKKFYNDIMEYADVIEFLEEITVPIKQSLEQDIENPMIGMLPNLEEET